MDEAVCVLDCMVHDDRRFHRTQSSKLCDGLSYRTIRAYGLCGICNFALACSASNFIDVCSLGGDRLRASYPLSKFVCVVVAICPIFSLLFLDRDRDPFSSSMEVDRRVFRVRTVGCHTVVDSQWISAWQKSVAWYQGCYNTPWRLLRRIACPRWRMAVRTREEIERGDLLQF